MKLFKRFNKIITINGEKSIPLIGMIFRNLLKTGSVNRINQIYKGLLGSGANQDITARIIIKVE